jgi:hypothetical protein
MQEGVYRVTLLRLTITIFDLKISELDKIMLSFIYVFVYLIVQVFDTGMK